MAVMSSASKVVPDLTAQKGRVPYIYGLTGILLVMAVVFGYFMPDSSITEVIVKEGFGVLNIVVISYLAAESVDKAGLLQKLPGIRARSREIEEAKMMEREEADYNRSRHRHRNDDYAEPVG